MAQCLERLWGAYLFDLDGTLIDTAPDLHRALNHALDEFGFAHVEESLARRFIGHGALVMIERAISHQEAQHSDPAELLDVFLGYYAEHICDASVAYPEVADTLAELRSRGAKLAVVTNKRKHFADLLIEQMGWRHHFDTIVGGDTAAQPKPAADPVVLTSEEIGVPLSNILFIGDSATDVGAARAADVPVVVVRDGYNEGIPACELGADAVIDGFSELLPP